MPERMSAFGRLGQAAYMPAPGSSRLEANALYQRWLRILSAALYPMESHDYDDDGGPSRPARLQLRPGAASASRKDREKLSRPDRARQKSAKRPGRPSRQSYRLIEAVSRSAKVSLVAAGSGEYADVGGSANCSKIEADMHKRGRRVRLPLVSSMNKLRHHCAITPLSVGPCNMGVPLGRICRRFSVLPNLRTGAGLGGQ